MELKVDLPQRYAKMRAHTATHLLHAQLAKIFPHTKQAWSLVDDDLLRFDFQADRLLTDLELNMIEKRVNQIIYLAAQVKVEEYPIEQARTLWAKMFFDEKYWDIVRVVQIFNKELPQEMKIDDNENYFLSFWDKLSIEFCGGTHVSNTKEIWAFVIVSQEAVASGIKRISALTGPRVIERLHEIKSTLRQVESKLWVKAENQILDKLDKELKEKEEMNSKFESINTKMIIDCLKNWEYKSNNTFDKIINVSENPILKDLSFKDITFNCKSVFEWLDIVVFNNDWWYAIITSKKSAKDIANQLWIRGGWNENIVQWKDPKIIEII